MQQYAKEQDHELVYAQAVEFRGISNWRTNEPAIRHAGYLPVRGDPEDREGYTAKPSAWHAVEQTRTRTEPRPFEVEDYEEDPDTHERRRTGSHMEWRDVEITMDASYIQIDEWEYIPIPAPEPPPLRRQFSKGDLLEALVACGLYEQAKAVYAADMDLQIAWAGFADIDMDYPACKGIMQQYPDLFSAANVEQLQRFITFGPEESGV